MTIPIYTTDLYHLALAIEATEFVLANKGNVFVEPTNL